MSLITFLLQQGIDNMDPPVILPYWNSIDQLGNTRRNQFFSFRAMVSFVGHWRAHCDINLCINSYMY